ncbi:methyltransferase [Gregarina niphandrodes]|uniref:Ribosomal RNA-processing protein 8 n=1 Tax=Gregarina niphandrodes TaxID=110365 RepID=A0A023B6H4_GRENI|nr:methyltransferase [Gregarina niphandrodes]EZG66548.1 methyltransferase [Gregarina niphandrodes]|eukprot:XP_011130618.1 methyltransferase [Gregarina niphandrodes]
MLGVKRRLAKSASAKPLDDTRALKKLRLCEDGRVKGGKFRRINELLYTLPSDEALHQLKAERSLNHATHYHEGYDEQMTKWPCHPLDKILPAVKRKIETENARVILDIGCGSCRVHRELSTMTGGQASGQTEMGLERKGAVVIAVDFAAPVGRGLPPKRATAEEYIKRGGFLECSAAHVALPDDCADVAIFSLSLMGTDWPTFIGEAVRLVKKKGSVFIAEVSSRFKQPGKFIRELNRCGLVLVKQQDLDSYFSIMTFRVQDKSKFDQQLISADGLKPCLYNRTKAHKTDKDSPSDTRSNGHMHKEKHPPVNTGQTYGKWKPNSTAADRTGRN